VGVRPFTSALLSFVHSLLPVSSVSRVNRPLQFGQLVGWDDGYCIWIQIGLKFSVNSPDASYCELGAVVDRQTCYFSSVLPPRWEVGVTSCPSCHAVNRERTDWALCAPIGRVMVTILPLLFYPMSFPSAGSDFCTIGPMASLRVRTLKAYGIR
jgi:hypothetical protein